MSRFQLVVLPQFRKQVLNRITVHHAHDVGDGLLDHPLHAGVAGAAHVAGHDDLRYIGEGVDALALVPSHIRMMST
jgi:hypothetical protein